MSAKLFDRFVEMMLGEGGGDARSEALPGRLVDAHHGLPQNLPGFFLHAATTRDRPVAEAITDFGV